MPSLRLLLSRPSLTAFALGGLAILGYAPYYIYPATLLALAGLFYLLHQSDDARVAARIGFTFGLGLFGFGVSWIFISLHQFGGMPAPLALLATATFCAFLALFPALAGFLVRRHGGSFWIAPFCWVLVEWVRGWIFTGFPWLTTGYSQIPYSPLSGLAPIGGIYGVSLAVAVCASLIAAKLAGRISGKTLAAWLIAGWIAASATTHVEWSVGYGKPVSFSLLQGNIAQDLKWRDDELQRTLNIYATQVLASNAQLIVLPEMAFPLLLEDLPAGYLEKLASHARRQGGDLLVGVPEAVRSNGAIRYFNSMLSFGSAPTQIYRKSHLVPFGEFIPFKPLIGWIYREWLHIPLADLAPGAPEQNPMALAGQQVAFNICYEDVFGEEIIRQLPQATLLINVSNDAWYGESLAAHQHLQMSQARAMETSRMVLRATNTGATAVIDREGRIRKELPHFTRANLGGEVQGYTGTTPYVRWGNLPVIVIVLGTMAVAEWRRKKRGEAGR